MVINFDSPKKAKELNAQILGEMKTHELGEVALSIAIGYATKIDATEDVEEVLRVADNKMYKNKKCYKKIIQ